MYSVDDLARTFLVIFSNTSSYSDVLLSIRSLIVDRLSVSSPDLFSVPDFVLLMTLPLISLSKFPSTSKNVSSYIIWLVSLLLSASGVVVFILLLLALSYYILLSMFDRGFDLFSYYYSFLLIGGFYYGSGVYLDFNSIYWGLFEAIYIALSTNLSTVFSYYHCLITMFWGISSAYNYYFY